MSLAPADMKIVCQTCADGEVSTILPLDEHAEHVSCETCHSTYRVVSGEVLSVRTQQLGLAQTQYELQIADASGRARVRAVRAQPGVSLATGRWVSLVWLRSTLVGVADQSQSNWWRVELPTRRDAPLWRVLLWACGLLVLLQTAHWVVSAADLLGRSNESLAIIVALVVLALMPAVLWTVQAARGTHELPQEEDPFPWLQDLD